MQAPLGWTGLGQWAFVLAAFAGLVLGVWQIDRQRRGRPVSRAAIAAVLIGAVWALLQAALGPHAPVALLADMARNLAWLLVVYALFARDGRHESVAPVRPVLIVLAVVELLQVVLLVLDWRFAAFPVARAMIFQIAVMLRLLVITGALVLVHNLYAGAMTAQRSAVRWTCAALAVIWGYDLNFYTIAYLVRGTPAELVSLRALAALLGVALLAAGAVREQTTGRFSPSRTVAFQSLSLLVIGGYMLVMVGVAQSIAWAGGSATMLTQLGFVFASSVLVLALMPSGRLRGWLNVMLSKHFFQHRYDYRAEWLRFNATIGRGGARGPGGMTSGAGDTVPLHTRVIQAVADITDSARGALLVPADSGELVLAARWQWPTLDVPAQGLDAAGAAFFETHGFIVDLDEVRGGIDHRGEAQATPVWMIEEEAVWALVPLLHFDRLVGLVVLGRPAVARQLDWEDFDLLRVVGHQLASYIAENNGQLALLEASRFDEFNRRIAFVMHDIKNLASQLGLLARNAQRHADNPEFRKDMLVTLSNSADKLNALIARLSRYGAGNVEQLAAVDAVAVAQALAGRWPHGASGAQVVVTVHDPCTIMANRETLEQVLAHLVQNAIDASPPGQTVRVELRSEALHGCIDVIDAGTGMSAEFVRNNLFKPFVSTKAGGFGIGAFEARELVHAMRGRLDVESREGLGSRFSVRLPLAAAAALSPPYSQQDVA